MPSPFRWRSLDSGLVLAAVDLEFDRQGWITDFAALLLALITLFTNYTHVDLLGAAFVELPQQAGISCIIAAVETAIEQQVGIQRPTRKCLDSVLNLFGPTAMVTSSGITHPFGASK